jgi:hypothetical protein
VNGPPEDDEGPRGQGVGLQVKQQRHSEHSTFAVVCIKSSGARLDFQFYPTREEAELVATRLRSWKCGCEVEERQS